MTAGGTNRVTIDNIEDKYRTQEHFMDHFSFRREEVFELMDDLQVCISVYDYFVVFGVIMPRPNHLTSYRVNFWCYFFTPHPNRVKKIIFCVIRLNMLNVIVIEFLKFCPSNVFSFVPSSIHILFDSLELN